MLTFVDGIDIFFDLSGSSLNRLQQFDKNF